MCEHCEFKHRPENKFPNYDRSGKVWFETDDAGDRCGEACLLEGNGYWLCHGSEEHGYNSLLVRVRYCPCCGRDLLPQKIKSRFKVGDVLCELGDLRRYYYKVKEVAEEFGEPIYALEADYGEMLVCTESEFNNDWSKVDHVGQTPAEYNELHKEVK